MIRSAINVTSFGITLKSLSICSDLGSCEANWGFHIINNIVVNELYDGESGEVETFCHSVT